VAGDPADIGGAPEDLAAAVIKKKFVRHRRPDEIATGRVQHALRLAGRSRRVEDEQRVFRVHRLGRAVRRCRREGIRIIEISAGLEPRAAAGASHNQHRVDARAAFQRGIDIGFERHRLAAAIAFVRCDDEPAIAILDAAGEAVRRKAPNTIEWIAPMRVQASMAAAASGIIGRYRVIRSPLRTPSPFRALASRQTSA
jgi:hypothetical protein